MSDTYTLTTWPYYKVATEDTSKIQTLEAHNDTEALYLAEKAIFNSPVYGTLLASDGRQVARYYFFLCKPTTGEEKSRRAGSIQFFAADDEEAERILRETGEEWMNALKSISGRVFAEQ